MPKPPVARPLLDRSSVSDPNFPVGQTTPTAARRTPLHRRRNHTGHEPIAALTGAVTALAATAGKYMAGSPAMATSSCRLRDSGVAAEGPTLG